MIEYKAHYMKIIEDDIYNLGFSIFVPDEGYTYQFEQDKPKTLDDAPGEWLDIHHLGLKGWELVHIITKNLLLIGIFQRGKKIQEVNIIEEIRHIHPTVVPNVTEVFSLSPRPVEPQKIQIALVEQDPKIEKPAPALTRLIYESDDGNGCLECGSSFKKKFFRKTKHCIQPECKNYWEKH